MLASDTHTSLYRDCPISRIGAAGTFRDYINTTGLAHREDARGRRVSVYTFKLEAYASVDALWLDFAKAVRYHPRRHRDVIFAARLNADDTEGAGYMLAHKRDDQRKFEAPPYLARYTPSIGNRGCGNTDLAILGALWDVGSAQRTNLAVVHPDVPTPLEVLAKLRDLPDRQRQ